jgi:hypothetical protein
MNTPLQLRCHRVRRWHLLAVAAFLVCCLTVTALGVVVLHAHRPTATSALAMAANGAQSSQGLDPTKLIADPASFDTRPCAANPSPDTCNGKYPVSPPHVSPSLGVQIGAGACIDGSHKIVENQIITDTAGKAVGGLQLWWLGRSHAYFGYVSFSLPLSQVQSASILVQTETRNRLLQWFDNVSQLPPLVTSTEQTGPVSGRTLASSDMLGQQLYSPLIYSPSDPVSAHIDIELSAGIRYANYTASYAGAVKQYIG